MSQDTHRLYKKMMKFKSEYYRFKRGGRSGIRKDYYDYMLVEYRYNYLKKLLEYILLVKFEEIEERLIHDIIHIPSDKRIKTINDELNKDKKLINLRRLVKLTKTNMLLKKQQVF